MKLLLWYRVGCVAVTWLGLYVIYLISDQRILRGRHSALLCSQQQLNELTIHQLVRSDEVKTSGLSTTQDLASKAMEIFCQKGIVLFTVINDAYVDFAASWMCNTASMGDIHQHVLFLSTDRHSGRRLQRLWPDVSIVVMETPLLSGDQTYSHAGYVRLMVERTRYILTLLESGILLLLFEVDCVWLSNPLPLLLEHLSEVDVTATRVENRTAGGFLLLNPTSPTLALWRQLTAQMNNLSEELGNTSDSTIVSWQLNDQEYLSDLIKDRFGGIHVIYLSNETFPDGRWYFIPEEQRNTSLSPVIINNNFIRGNAAKRTRAQRFGHWFLNVDVGLNFSCNSTAVKAIVQL